MKGLNFCGISWIIVLVLLPTIGSAAREDSSAKTSVVVKVSIPLMFLGKSLNWCQLHLSRLRTRSAPSTTLYNWKRGDIPPEALWKQVALIGPSVPPPGSELVWLTSIRTIFDEWPSLFPNDGSIYVSKELGNGALQKIEENGDFEKNLLRESSPETLPHEVWKIRTTGSFGDFQSQTFHGGAIDARISFHVLKRVVRAVRTAAVDQTGSSDIELEFNHSHPYPELIVDGKLRLAMLSAEDIELGFELSREFPDIPIIIRATTVMATYSVKFLNGSVVPWVEN